MNIVKSFSEFIFEFQITPKQWIDYNLKDIDDDGMQQIWDMYIDTYSKAGMDFSADDYQEMRLKYKAAFLKDVDSDKSPDAFIIYKVTPYGNKIALLGTNGKREAKRELLNKLFTLLKKRGWFIEASLKMEEILSSSKIPVVYDETAIRDIVGGDKDPQFTERGYYTRLLSKASKRITKRIYGVLL